MRKYWKARRTGALAAFIAAGLIGGICRADETKRRFDIPAGKASERFNDLIAELGLAMVCDFKATGAATTKAVHGVYTLQEALEKMSEGQNIQFWFPKPGMVSCGPRKAPVQTVTKPGADPQERKLLEPVAMDQVVVTGSHIRGRSPYGTQVITLSKADIERTGLSTVADVIRTLPQNFDGGPTEDTQGIGRETLTNSARGNALNIRGLGPAETLVLLNGRRLAPGGTEGAFVDISSIPLSAVDQIEVLLDSGSALYGADAIGGIVNITLKKEYSGAETQARAGASSDRALDEYQLSHTLGTTWSRGNGLLALDIYRRSDLRGEDRRQAQSDLRSLGGDNFDTWQSNPGTLFAGGIPWAIPRGQDGKSLAPSDFTPDTLNLEDQRRGADLLPVQKRWSLIASGNHALSDEIELFSDALFSQRDVHLKLPSVRGTLPVTVANPFYVNPTGGTEPIAVSYDFLDDLDPSVADIKVRTFNMAVGGRINAGARWRIVPYLSYAREEQRIQQRGLLNGQKALLALLDPDPTTAFNPFGDGSHTNPATLAGLRSQSFFESNSSIGTLDVTADGPLLPLPSGMLKFALGANLRREDFNSLLQSDNTGLHPIGVLSRDVSALFGELLVPLADANSPRLGLQQLELSVALRFEDYSDVSRTTAPKFGLLWSPVKGLLLRGTWTESFRAPNLADLFEGDNGSTIMAVRDDSVPGGFSQALVWFGKNANLRPEAAHSWTVGVEFTAPGLNDSSVALTYFDIQIQNAFEENSFADDILDNTRFASLVTRNPTAAQREVVCARSTFGGFPGGCMGAPIEALIDLRLGNNAILATSGFDLVARRKFDSPWGRFDLSLNTAYVLRYGEAETMDSPLIDLVDTQNNPLRLHTRGSISWQRRNIAATAFVNHDGSYRDVARTPHRKVGAWTTLDLQLRYDLNRNGAGWLADTHFFLNAQNVFDRDPPFLNNHLGIGYDAENADLLGRFISFDIRKNW